jgi:hypothetical protein
MVELMRPRTANGRIKVVYACDRNKIPAEHAGVALDSPEQAPPSRGLHYTACEFIEWSTMLGMKGWDLLMSSGHSRLSVIAS